MLVPLHWFIGKTSFITCFIYFDTISYINYKFFQFSDKSLCIIYITFLVFSVRSSGLQRSPAAELVPHCHIQSSNDNQKKVSLPFVKVTGIAEVLRYNGCWLFSAFCLTLPNFGDSHEREVLCITRYVIWQNFA
jgi:hypothetical protein